MTRYLYLDMFASERAAQHRILVLRATGDTPQQWPIEYPGGWVVVRFPVHRCAPKKLVARLLARWKGKAHHA